MEIAHLELAALKSRMHERGIKLTYERGVAAVIAGQADQRGSGARGIKQIVEDLIAIPVSNKLIASTGREQTWLHIENRRDEIFLGWV
jgi:ATP-dependent Clp protease ATP-binding subunit ClpA